MRGVARIAVNALRDPDVRRRMLAMRATFHAHADHLCAAALAARAPE